VTSELYNSYSQMKGWSAVGGSGDPYVFENIVSAANKQGTLRIFEIGFGDGSFLDWARQAGHHVCGMEIIPECICAARARGHSVYSPDEVSTLPKDSFDLIVAIDVLEHLNLSQLADVAKLAANVLRHDGLIVARFPNGDSPFCGHNQAGDFTHERALTAQSVHQVLSRDGFVVIRSANPRPKRGTLSSKLKGNAAYFVRDLIEIFLGFVYFGYRFPMDPNIIVVLARATANAAK
jgi:2-polyprenyl-3-methyl-5-hydroxy-6-metoxy-1,4-benzoquinol methylase